MTRRFGGSEEKKQWNLYMKGKKKVMFSPGIEPGTYRALPETKHIQCEFNSLWILLGGRDNRLHQENEH